MINYYLPMADPEYIFTREEHPCEHVTVHYAEGWIPELFDFAPLCPECKK